MGCQGNSLPILGARLRGRTATQRSKKGSEKVLGRALGKGSQKGSEKGTVKEGSEQSGPLNRLNAILSLLQPLDRYRAPSAIGSAIERAPSRPISLPCPGKSSQPPRSKPLRGLNRAIVAL